MLPSLNGLDYRIYTNGNPSTYELGVLRRAMKDTTDDIFLLQDSCEVKDQRLFKICAAHKGGMALNSTFQMYLGKYDSSVLRDMVIPIPDSKTASVYFESEFNRLYINRDPNFSIFSQPLNDTSIFEEKFGHKNMILENDYIKKYKRCWSNDMIKEFT